MVSSAPGDAPPLSPWGRHAARGAPPSLVNPPSLTTPSKRWDGRSSRRGGLGAAAIRQGLNRPGGPGIWNTKLETYPATLEMAQGCPIRGRGTCAEAQAGHRGCVAGDPEATRGSPNPRRRRSRAISRGGLHRHTGSRDVPLLVPCVEQLVPSLSARHENRKFGSRDSASAKSDRTELSQNC